MSSALSIDHDLTMKMESQIDDLKRFKDSMHLGSLLTMAEFMLGSSHILVAILRSIFAYDSTGFLARSARFFSDGVRASIQTMSSSQKALMTKSASLQEVASQGANLANESNVHEVPFYKHSQILTKQSLVLSL